MTQGSMSNYLEKRILDHVLRDTAFTSPSQIWLGLYTSSPGESGSSGSEVTGGSYVRMPISGSFSVTTSVGGVSYDNDSDIIFYTATGSWGNVSHIAILNDSTAGSMLFYGALSASIAIYAGDTFKISAGNLDINIGGHYSQYLAGKVLDSVLNGTAYVSPGTDVYVALYTSNPTYLDVGTEVVAGDYARIKCAGNTQWDDATSGSTANTADVSFISAASAGWGTITSVGIRDALSAGNLLFFTDLQTTRTVENGDGFIFPAGQLRVDADYVAPPS